MQCLKQSPFGLLLFLGLGLSFCSTRERRVFFEVPKSSHYLEECILTQDTQDTLLYFYYSFDALTYKFKKQKSLPIGLQFTIHSNESYRITYCGTNGLQMADSLFRNADAPGTSLQNFRGNISDRMLSSGFAVLRDPERGIKFMYLPGAGYIHREDRFEHFAEMFSQELNAAARSTGRVIIKTVLVDENNVYAHEKLLNL